MLETAEARWRQPQIEVVCRPQMEVAFPAPPARFCANGGCRKRLAAMNGNILCFACQDQVLYNHRRCFSKGPQDAA